MSSKEVCKFVQMILDDIVAERYSEPRIFCGSLSSLSSYDSRGCTRWHIGWDDWVFWSTLRVERPINSTLLSRTTKVDLNSYERRLLKAALSQVEKKAIQKAKVLRKQARDW